MRPHEFRAAREALGLTQKDLAALWGKPERTIRRWENWESPIDPVAIYCIKMMLATQTEKEKTQ